MTVPVRHARPVGPGPGGAGRVRAMWAPAQPAAVATGTTAG